MPDDGVAACAPAEGALRRWRTPETGAVAVSISWIKVAVLCFPPQPGRR